MVDVAKQQNISFYRGSEHNVMQRVLQAAESVQADVVVELTGDNPIIDPKIISHCIALFKANKVDYLNNVEPPSYPVGMAVQVFTLEALSKSFSMTNDSLDLEHVTRHIRQNPDLFSLLYFVAPPDCFMPDCEVTLDELADYELIQNIIEYFSDKDPDF